VSTIEFVDLGELLFGKPEVNALTRANERARSLEVERLEAEMRALQYAERARRLEAEERQRAAETGRQDAQESQERSRQHAERERRAEAEERQRAVDLSRQHAREMEGIAATLRDAEARETEAREGLMEMARRLSASREASRELSGQVAQDSTTCMRQLEEVAVASDRARADAAAAGRSLQSAEAGGRIGTEAVAGLAAASAADAGIASQIAAKAKRIQEVESELLFLRGNSGLPGVLTLHAMKENGYHLAETVSREGMIGYFEDDEGKHRIAVRTRAAESTETKADRWTLEAETFGMAKDECLERVSDFRDAIAEAGLATVTVASRKHPKRDGETGIPVREPARNRIGQRGSERRERA
jgi:hypothetical protein